MPAYTVRFSALGDLRASIDVDAQTPQDVVAIARSRLDAGDDPDACFELPDNGIDPIVGTTEAISVDDAEGDEVLTLPYTSGNEIADLIAGQVARERQLLSDLWWFIENVNPGTPSGTDDFFKLRERVRTLPRPLPSTSIA